MRTNAQERLLALLDEGSVATEIPATRAGHKRFARINKFVREPGGSHDWMYPDKDPFRYFVYRFEMSNEDLASEDDLPDECWLDWEEARVFSEAELFALLDAWHLSPIMFRRLREVDDIPP